MKNKTTSKKKTLERRCPGCKRILKSRDTGCKAHIAFIGEEYECKRCRIVFTIKKVPKNKYVKIKEMWKADYY